MNSNHHLHFRNGQFAETSMEQLRETFDRLIETPPKRGIVVHFHGGLVNQSAALTTAEILTPQYIQADVHPLFPIWESGAAETVRNNLRDIADEPFFRKLVSHLAGYLRRRVVRRIGSFWSGELFDGQESSIASVETPSGQYEETRRRVEIWLAAGQQDVDPVFPDVSLDDPLELEVAVNQDIDEAELASLLDADENLRDVYDRLRQRSIAEPMVEPVAGPSAPPVGQQASSEDETFDGVASASSQNRARTLVGADTRLGGDIKRDLFDGAASPSDPAASPIDPGVLEGDEGVFSSVRWSVRVARVAIRITRRCLRRYREKRDHGFTTTIIEETLREMHADAIGSTFFWDQMKKDTIDAFGDDTERFGGSALLEQIHRYCDTMLSDDPARRITLVGHSAGAIFVSNFLVEANKRLPEGLRFDVILLAPAVDASLMRQAIDTGRIAAIRVFAMKDKLERRDAMLASTSDLLRWVYPSSLLYFVSGLLEETVDHPIVGMQRFYDTSVYTDDGFEDLAAVRSFLVPYPDRLVWSIDRGPVGRRSSSTSHGDFDREDAETLGSVLHILRYGFESPIAKTPGAGSVSKVDPILDDLAESLRRRRVAVTRISPNINIDLAAEGLVSAREQSRDARLVTPTKLNVLVEATEHCEMERIDGIEVLSRVGNFWCVRVAAEGVDPLAARADVISVSPAGESSAPECLDSLPFVGVMDAAGNRLEQRGGRCIVAAIDGGFDMIHAAFRRPDIRAADGSIESIGPTRFLAVWDQFDPTGPPPPGFEAIGGTLHTATDIDGYLVTGVAPNSDSPRLGHGTHVLSIAAGTDLRDRANFPGGVATESPLIGVAAATRDFEQGSPESLGYSVSHLAALDFIDRVAKGTLGDESVREKIYRHFNLDLACPVVVNVSQGKNLGGHDGGSALERAFDAFTDGGRKPGRVVVKSAGNSRADALHAYVTLSSNGRERLTWQSDQGITTRHEQLRSVPDVMELWFDSRNELTFALELDGQTGPFVNYGEHQKFKLDNLDCDIRYIRWDRDSRDASRVRISVLGVKENASLKDSTECSMVMVGEPPDTHPAWYRTLRLSISSGHLVETAKIDAWMERLLQPRLPFPRYSGSHVSEDRTLSIPGTAETVITVGAISSSEPIEVAHFSAYGGTRIKKHKPDVVAPGAYITAAAAGTGSGVVAKPGTSMAAPHVAGAIAMAMSESYQSGRSLTANELANLLRTKAWDRGQGYGPLDVTELLQRARSIGDASPASTENV